MGMIGDLGFLAADWPMANEIAERIRRNIEQTMPWLLKDGEIGPLVAKLTAELKDQQAQTAELMEKLAETRVRVRGKDELRDIEVYDAQTKRLTAEGNVVADFSKLGGEAGGLKKLIEQTVAQMMGFGLEEIEKANKDVIQQKEQDTVEPTQ
jgi:hypothetical protein